MSKEKTGQVPRHEKQERYICLYPKCNKTYWLADSEKEGRPPLCPDCLKLLHFLMWALPHIKVKPKDAPQPGSGLILPKGGEADRFIADFNAELAQKTKGG